MARRGGIPGLAVRPWVHEVEKPPVNDNRTFTPVKHNGRTVGRAELSPDFEIINIELESGLVPSLIRVGLLGGLADGISISLSMTPAVSETPN